MQPELALSSPTREISAQALNQAFISWTEHQNIRKNLIILPSDRDPFIRVLHYQDNILQGVVIHPQQGNVIPIRATGGGEFIDGFHRHLFIGHNIGGAIVLGIGIAFIFVLISGVIIYLPTLIKKAFLFILNQELYGLNQISILLLDFSFYLFYRSWPSVVCCFLHLSIYPVHNIHPISQHNHIKNQK